MPTYLAAYFAALCAALALTPLLIRVATRAGLVDEPGLRTVHTRLVPRIGGVAIAVPTIVGILVPFAVDTGAAWRLQFAAPEYLSFLLAGILVFAAGLYDDLRGLRARYKLSVQLVAAAAVMANGTLINELAITDTKTLSLGWVAWPLTMLWIVGVTNAVNLIDGLDGLAAGVSVIACGVLGAVSIGSSSVTLAMVFVALSGGLCGFLAFNFNPARVFMGDCGSLFVGFGLAVGSVMFSQSRVGVAGSVLPLLALGVPVLDTLFAIVRRALARRSIFSADCGHIHHRLLEMGLSQRQVVSVLCALTGVSCCLGGLMFLLDGVARLMPVIGAGLMLLAAFRVTGVLRLRESIAHLHRNTAIIRERQEERRALEEAQLCFRRIANLEDWWASAAMAAEILGLSELQMIVGPGRREKEGGQVPGGRPSHLLGGVNDRDRLVWRGSERPGRRLRVRIPIHTGASGVSALILTSMPVNGSVEAAARRSALMGRLIDENPPTRLLLKRLGKSWRSGRQSPVMPPVGRGGDRDTRDLSWI